MALAARSDFFGAFQVYENQSTVAKGNRPEHPRHNGLQILLNQSIYLWIGPAAAKIPSLSKLQRRLPDSECAAPQ